MQELTGREAHKLLVPPLHGKMEKTLNKLCALLLVTTARAAFGEATSYVNRWAVEVHGGWEEAERVALKHGFQLREKVTVAK